LIDIIHMFQAYRKTDIVLCYPGFFMLRPLFQVTKAEWVRRSNTVGDDFLFDLLFLQHLFQGE
jgi:hypothetical protein